MSVPATETCHESYAQKHMDQDPILKLVLQLPAAICCCKFEFCRAELFGLGHELLKLSFCRRCITKPVLKGEEAMHSSIIKDSWLKD